MREREREEEEGETDRHITNTQSGIRHDCIIRIKCK